MLHGIDVGTGKPSLAVLPQRPLAQLVDPPQLVPVQSHQPLSVARVGQAEGVSRPLDGRDVFALGLLALTYAYSPLRIVVGGGVMKTPRLRTRVAKRMRELSQADAALNRLAQAVPQIKKNVLDACAQTVAADGVIQEMEAELLRAIADTLDCPMPPFVADSSYEHPTSVA